MVDEDENRNEILGAVYKSLKDVGEVHLRDIATLFCRTIYVMEAFLAYWQFIANTSKWAKRWFIPVSVPAVDQVREVRPSSTLFGHTLCQVGRVRP